MSDLPLTPRPSGKSGAAGASEGRPLTPPTPAALPTTVPVTVRRGLGDDSAQGNFWQQIGGRPTFEKLVRRFYEGVRTDDVLWPMYPEEDLEGAIQRLTGAPTADALPQKP